MTLIPASYTILVTSTVNLKEIKISRFSTAAKLTKMCCGTLPVFESRGKIFMVIVYPRDVTKANRTEALAVHRQSIVCC